MMVFRFFFVRAVLLVLSSERGITKGGLPTEDMPRKRLTVTRSTATALAAEEGFRPPPEPRGGERGGGLGEAAPPPNGPWTNKKPLQPGIVQSCTTFTSTRERWFWRASHSRIESVKELAHKIKRHMGSILNTLRHGLSNARIEATNNKIKSLVRRAYGFRNLQNMFAYVKLICSKVEILLPNRPVPS